MKMTSTRIILSPVVRCLIFLLAIGLEVVIAVVKANGIQPPIPLEVIGHVVTAVTGLFSVRPELQSVKAGLTRQLSRQLSATQPSHDPDIERFLSATSELSQPGPTVTDHAADAGPGVCPV